MKNSRLYDIIIAPLFSEKISTLSESGKYVFKVKKEATKSQLKKAFSEIFGVKLLKINVINTYAKKKVFKGVKGSRSSIKKVVVTVGSGAIDFMQGVK